MDNFSAYTTPNQQFYIVLLILGLAMYDVIQGAGAVEMEGAVDDAIQRVHSFYPYVYNVYGWDIQLQS